MGIGVSGPISITLGVASPNSDALHCKRAYLRASTSRTGLNFHRIVTASPNRTTYMGTKSTRSMCWVLPPATDTFLNNNQFSGVQDRHAKSRYLNQKPTLESCVLKVCGTYGGVPSGPNTTTHDKHEPESAPSS